MGVMIGARFKAVAVVLVVASFIFAGAPHAEASANLTAWLSTPPNSFEPMGYTVNGTSAKYVVDTLGWSATKIMGNVGIGDGSAGTLNRTSNQAVNHTDDYILAADASMAPWDPGRITGAEEAPAAANATKNVSSSNVTGKLIDLSLSGKAANNTTAANETGNETGYGQVGTGGFGGKLAAMRLNDPYHSILMGRPVDDMCYQAPFAISISMYARLIGLPMPSGGCANIGIRNLGYGY